MSEELSVSAVTGWEVRTITSLQALLLQFSFIAPPFKRPEEAQKTSILVVDVQQVRELIEVLQKGVDRVESFDVSPPPGQKH